LNNDDAKIQLLKTSYHTFVAVFLYPVYGMFLIGAQ